MSVRESDDRKPAPAAAAVQRDPGRSVRGSGTLFERFLVTEPVDQPDRDPAGATVMPTGLTRTNTAGYLLTQQLVSRLGLDPTSFAVGYGINKEKRQIALYPVHPRTLGAAPVRRDQANMVMTFYLKPVFKAHNDLRVQSRRQCSLYLDVDAGGDECLVLSLNVGLEKRRIRRTPAEGGGG